MRANDVAVRTRRRGADHRAARRGVWRAPLNRQARRIAASGVGGEADVTGYSVGRHHCLCEEDGGLSITSTISKDQACDKHPKNKNYDRKK